MSDFKIIQTWLYHQRVIYLTKIQDKFQMFYRSTGLAGYDSKGNILPLYLLKETKSEESWMGDEFGGMVHGWLPKVYKKKDLGFVPYYNKNEDTFPLEMQKYMNEIRTFNKNVKPNDLPKIIPEDCPFTINIFCRTFVKTDDNWKEW